VVNPHGAATAYVFEYGTSTAFGQIAPLPAGNAGATTADQSVQAALSSLQANTTYFYRLVATSAQGTASGPVRAFTTGPMTAPVVTTGSASAIHSTAARLAGTVNPRGQATSLTFEYGTTTAFGQITSVDSAGEYAGVQQVSLPVSGLLPSTRYLYRIVASNATGTTSGPVMSFTTTAATYIYWANQGAATIGRGTDGGTQETQSFITTGTNPFGVAVDHGHIYWANSGSGTVGRAAADGTAVNQSFITGITNPAGVAVDSGHIYWTDFQANRIGRANLDGTGVSLAFITGAGGPMAVAVDAGHIYWANKTTNTIGRANLDGTGVSQSFITGASAPQGVAVDSGHIYWANFNGQSIGRANLDGTGANQNFIAFNCGTFCSIQPAGLAIDADFIYWTKFNQLSIGRANLDGTGVNQGFATAGAHPVGIAVGPPG
jgi:virginiamycin B lyase